MKKRENQTLHVSVIGIDGSGKSTFAASLPMLLAAEYELQAGGAGETYVVNGPEEDHLTTGFAPEGIPFTARISTLFLSRVIPNFCLCSTLKVFFIVVLTTHLLFSFEIS